MQKSSTAKLKMNGDIKIKDFAVDDIVFQYHSCLNCGIFQYGFMPQWRNR